MAADIPVRVIIDAIDNASKSFQSVAGHAGKLTDSLQTLGIAGAALGVGVGLLTRDFIAQAGAMEQNTIAFETMTGSAKVAATLLADIREFAKKTPFNVTELVEGSKRLLAYNVEAKDLIPTLGMLGDITSGVGREKLPQLILAFGQVKAATKLTGAELRQFSEAGVPLLDALVKQANSAGGAWVTTGGAAKKAKVDVAEMNDQLAIARKRLEEASASGKTKESTLMSLRNRVQNYEQKLAGANETGKAASRVWVENSVTAKDMIQKISDGEVTFDMVQKAMAGMTAEGGKFHDLMQKQSKSTLGKVSNLQDAWQQMSVTIGQSLTPTVNKLLDAVIPMVEKVGAWAKENPQIVTQIAAITLVVASLAASILPLIGIVKFLSAGFTALSATWGIISAVGSGVITILGGIVAAVGLPLILAVTAVTAAIVGLALAWKNNWFDIQGKTQAAMTMISEAIEIGKLKIQELILWFQNLPTTLQAIEDAMRAGFYVFMTETIPYAIGYLVARLIKFQSEEVPAFVIAVVKWFMELPKKTGELLLQMLQIGMDLFHQLHTQVINIMASMVKSFIQWLGQVPSSTSNILSQMPGIFAENFNKAKNVAVGIAREIYEGVKGWIDKVINLFNDIIGKAGEAINKAREAATAGFSVGRRQYGGPVSAASQYVVGEAGPESFVPQTAGYINPSGKYEDKGRGGGAGVTIQFIINADLIVNSPTERRNIAEAIYADLVTLARSQNMTVAEMMGG